MKTLKNKIDESLIKSYDTNKLIDKIEHKYKNLDISLYPSKSNESLFRIIFDNKNDYKKYSFGEFSIMFSFKWF